MMKSHHYIERVKDFQLTITRSMLETLDINRTLYVILSGLTAGDGLDFNRAFLLLDDSGFRLLRGEMAIGPSSSEEAHRIWEEMEVQAFNLHLIMEHYAQFNHDNHLLTRQLQKFVLPMPLPEDSHDYLTSKIVEVMQQGRGEIINGQKCFLGDTGIEMFNFAMMPMMIGEKAIGIIIVDNAYNGRLIQPSEMDDLKSLTNLAAIAVERARMHERLKRSATVDGLTGLMNRRYFDEAYPECFKQAVHHHEPLSIAILDLDNFKSINDNYGHLTGDDLLKEIANIILSRVRRDDLAVRFGGDEMVLVLPLASLHDAEQLVLNLQRQIKQSQIADSIHTQITASIGVASLDSNCTSHLQLLERADRALYKAKALGRNRVVCYEKSAESLTD